MTSERGAVKTADVDDNYQLLNVKIPLIIHNMVIMHYRGKMWVEMSGSWKEEMKAKLL